MTTLDEIEAAAAALPVDEQQKLFAWLAVRLAEAPLAPSKRHSVLDIEAVSVGGILKPLSDDDDLLGEMLESRQ
jgi:hypothetical protein